MRLALGYEDRVELRRTMSVARLSWSWCFSLLLRVARRGEPCEAMSSPVVHEIAKHPDNYIFHQVYDRFMLFLLRTSLSRTCSRLMLLRGCHNSLIAATTSQCTSSMLEPPPLLVKSEV